MPANDGRVIIRISALPDSALRRALAGVVDAVRKTRRTTDGEQAKAGKAVKDFEAVRVGAAERAARAEIREAQKSARAQIREAERTQKTLTKLATRGAEERRRLMLAVGAGAYGAVRGAAELVGRGTGLAGMGSLEERLNNAGDFRAKLIRSAGEAGLKPEERARIEEKLLKVSEATNVSLMDLVGGLQTAQTRFSKFKEFSLIIDDIAKVSQATGEPLDDLIGAIGSISEAYQLDESGQRELTNAMIAMAERGAISPGDFARSMASKAGTFQMATGRTGVDAAREFMATAQVLGTSQSGAAESATMLERFAGRIALPDVQARLKQIGINTTDKQGRLLQVGDIGKQMAESKRFGQAGVRKWVFPEDEARNAAQFIVQELKRNPDAFTELQNIDAGAGAASIDKRFKELSSDPMFQLRNVGVRAQTDTVRDADRIVKTITPAVKKLAELQVQFPLLTESMGTLESSVRWAVGTLLADRFIRGGAGGTAFGTAAGDALGKVAGVSLATQFSQSNWAGKLGMGGQVMATAFLAYMTTSQILEATGWDKVITGWGMKLHDLVNGPSHQPPAQDTGTIVGNAALTTESKEKRAREAAVEDGVTNFLSSLAPAPLSPVAGPSIPAPLIPAAGAEAKLVIEFEGPGRIKSVDTDGFILETIAGNGRRDVYPP